MKKVPRLRIPLNEQLTSSASQNTISSTEMSVRTTGRIKKPKAVFDPSDNYLPRAQRSVVPQLAMSTATMLHQSQHSSITSGNGASVGVSRTINHRLCSTDSAPGISLVSSDACMVCQKREAKRGSHASKNKLISCTKCEKKVHRLCLDIEYEDIEYLRQNFNCENCRICVMCHGTSDTILGQNDNRVGQQELATCGKCLKSYHYGCHIPNVTTFMQNWKCKKCMTKSNNNNVVSNKLADHHQQQQDQQVNGNVMPIRPLREVIVAVKKSNEVKIGNDKVNIAAAAAEAKASSKRSHNEKNLQNSNERNGSEKRTKYENSSTGNACSSSGNINHNNNNNCLTYSPNEQIDIPDVKYWSVDQVTEYFSKYFPHEAYVFKDQEIDGTSLLLLKRSDVIKKLPIKLGPSLRMYNLILKIQTQSNDATLGWNCDL